MEDFVKSLEPNDRVWFEKSFDELFVWYIDEMRPYKVHILDIHAKEPDGVLSGFLYFVGCMRFASKSSVSQRYCFLYSMLYILVDHTMDNGDPKKVIQSILVGEEPLFIDIRNIYEEMNLLEPERKDLLFSSFQVQAHPQGTPYEQAIKKGSSIVRVFTNDQKELNSGSMIQLIDDIIDHEEDFLSGKPMYNENVEIAIDNAKKYIENCSEDLVSLFSVVIDFIERTTPSKVKCMLCNLQTEMIRMI